MFTHISHTMKTRISAVPSLCMLPLCFLPKWQPAISDAMTESKPMLLSVQVRIVAVLVIKPFCVTGIRLNLKNIDRTNENT